MTTLLSKCKQGEIHRVVEIKGNPDTKQFLSNLGLEEGDTISIITKLASNYIVNIKDSRFGIDKGIAKLIVVES
jgi:ferrous iron transport protein A